MKLILCPKCSDVVLLRQGKKRTCECKQSWGEYLEDGLNAVIGGQAIPLGFENRSFVAALKKRPEYGQGKEFSAFIIPVHCPTIQQEEKESLTPKKK